MIRLGLCCIFIQEPIKFRTVTAKSLQKYNKDEQLSKLNEIVLHNVAMIKQSLVYCSNNNIGCFRIQSGIMPLKTHPDVGYSLADLPDAGIIIESMNDCKTYAENNNIRTTFHPDQFVVLSSPHPNVVENSLNELKYQAELADYLGADVINIHCGGVYGDKKQSLSRLRTQIDILPDNIRSRLTLENDDRNYTPDDVIPLCEELSIPCVYDVHHHRCLQKDVSVEEITDKALATWNREPLFHLSSPKEGWQGRNPCFHSDYIDYADFPDCWKELPITVEVEAKAKELAVRKLNEQLKADTLCG